MHAVFITSNKRYFDPASVERQFLLMLSEVYSTLHTVVLTRPGYAIEQVNDHTWLYPTNTYLPGMRYFDALYVVRKQVAWGGQLYADVIISDDPFVSGWVGLKLASTYDRAWLVHVYDFYWKRPLRKRLFRWPALPLSAVLEGATRICVFSNRAQIYLESAANETQKEKLKTLIKMKKEEWHELIQVSSEKVAPAIIVGNLTTIVVFVPFFLLSKKVQILYAGMAITIISSLLASLFVGNNNCINTGLVNLNF
jgi:hypothetical protein